MSHGGDGSGVMLIVLRRSHDTVEKAYCLVHWGLVIGFAVESEMPITLREYHRPLRLEYRGYHRMFINTNWFHAHGPPLLYLLRYQNSRMQCLR